MSPTAQPIGSPDVYVVNFVVLHVVVGLGPETPPGSFASEMASARFLLLLALASLPPEEGASVDQLANLLLLY